MTISINVPVEFFFGGSKVKKKDKEYLDRFPEWVLVFEDKENISLTEPTMAILEDFYGVSKIVIKHDTAEFYTPAAAEFPERTYGFNGTIGYWLELDGLLKTLQLNRTVVLERHSKFLDIGKQLLAISEDSRESENTKVLAGMLGLQLFTAFVTYSEVDGSKLTKIFFEVARSFAHLKETEAQRIEFQNNTIELFINGATVMHFGLTKMREVHYVCWRTDEETLSGKPVWKMTYIGD